MNEYTYDNIEDSNYIEDTSPDSTDSTDSTISDRESLLPDKDEYTETIVDDALTGQLLNRDDSTDTAVRQFTNLRETDKQFEDKVHEREEATGRELVVVSDEERNIRMPLKVIAENKAIQIGRIPYWYLTCMGNMTISEFNRFVKSHRSELNLNEIAAADLLIGVIQKDATSVNRFWDIQKNITKSKSIIAQINNISIEKNENIKNIMNEISDGLFN